MVAISAFAKASTSPWYGVNERSGLRGGLAFGGGGVGAWMDGGREGGGVNIRGWGEAHSLRHLSASESHEGDGRWCPKRRTSCKYPKTPPPHKTHFPEVLRYQDIAAHPGYPQGGGGGSIFCRRDVEPPSHVSVCGSISYEATPAHVTWGHADWPFTFAQQGRGARSTGARNPLCCLQTPRVSPSPPNPPPFASSTTPLIPPPPPPPLIT